MIEFSNCEVIGMSKKKQRVNQESESYKLRQELDEWGRKLDRDSEDFAVQQSIKEKIWVLAFQIWSPYKENTSEQIERGTRTETKWEKGRKLGELEAEAKMDALVTVLKIVFRKFDPNRKAPGREEPVSLSAFIQIYLKWKIKGEKTKLGLGGEWVSDENTSDEMVWKPDIDMRSLDEPISSADETKHTVGELIQDESNPYAESEKRLKDEYRMLTIMSHVLKMMEQRNQDKRSKYIYEPLLFTNNVVNYCQLEEQPVSFSHENEMWDVMKEKFIDFCLEDFCRSLCQIQQSEMKTYRQIGRGDKSNADERIAIPMPHTVGLEYLRQIENKSVSAATYGEQSKKYRQSILRVLKENDLISDEV